MSSTAGQDAPPDLARWGLHAFALGARRTPHGVVAMDDNGPLLYHARRGVTREGLAERGITPSTSQLALLQAFDLIAVDGDLITTSFPVVEPALLSHLRPKIYDLAVSLVPAISDDISSIASALAERGHVGHDYAVVFGHALDGLLWDRLTAAGLAPTTELSVERPFWNGVFWAIYPARPASAGVNELPGTSGTLVMVWTPATFAALDELSRSAAVQAMLAEPSRQTTIPVVATDDNDLIHRKSQGIATTIADAFTPGGQAQELLDAIPDADRQQSVVIVAHELIWDIMEALTTAGRLEPPAALGGSAVTPEAVSTQLLIRTHE